jgi:hypothetical protein
MLLGGRLHPGIAGRFRATQLHAGLRPAVEPPPVAANYIFSSLKLFFPLLGAVFFSKTGFYVFQDFGAKIGAYTKC